MTETILTKLFVDIDDFMKEYEVQMKKQLITDGTIKRDRDTRLSLSEIMTIVLYFQISGYLNFKDYYTKHVMVHLEKAFPGLLSYNLYISL